MQNPSDDNLFTVKTANQWLRSARKKATPRMLFGEFWLEGELSIMFADTGIGKSLLAVQLGECIARGRAIAPLKMNARPQNVVFFDFELSEKQFEMRYAKEFETENGMVLKNHYRFSDRFSRVEIDLNTAVPNEFASFDTFLHARMEEFIIKEKAKVLIVDNLTYLKRSNESTREAIPLMQTLNRLKKKYGLSILVIAHTPKRDTSRPIVVNDLQGSKILANFADNIFAIGRSKQDTAGRYLKQIKPRSTDLIYDSSHVPIFRVRKITGNFLGFEHTAFSPESVHLTDVRDKREWELIDRIKQMTDAGSSIRQIADQLEMSKTTVHRYLQMWQPPPEQASEAVEEQGPSHCTHSPEITPGPQRTKRRVPQWIDPGAGWVDVPNEDGSGEAFPLTDENGNDVTLEYGYFPGSEEYRYAADDLVLYEADDDDDDACKCRTCETCLGPARLEHDMIYREGWVIETARANAFEIFESTGVAPVLDAEKEYIEFKEAVAAYKESGVVHEAIRDIVCRYFPQDPVPPAPEPEVVPPPPPAVANARPFLYDGTPEAEAWFQHLAREHPEMDDAKILRDYSAGEEWCRPPGAVPPYDPHDPFSRMRRAMDDYGNERFIETEFEGGTPRVWYQYASDGSLRRWERTQDGTSGQPANPNLFGKFAHAKPRLVAPPRLPDNAKMEVSY